MIENRSIKWFWNILLGDLWVIFYNYLIVNQEQFYYGLSKALLDSTPLFDAKDIAKGMERSIVVKDIKLNAHNWNLL